MTKRDVIRKGFYAVRDSKGRITDIVDIGRSIRMDRLTKTDARRIPKTKGGIARVGYGHIGDYERKGKFLW